MRSVIIFLRADFTTESTSVPVETVKLCFASERAPLKADKTLATYNLIIAQADIDVSTYAKLITHSEPNRNSF